MLDRVLKYPYWTIFGIVLYFFSFMSFQGYYFASWGDSEVYISIAQSMFHGGVVYKDAIDTKNIGFFISYYLMYCPYAILFDTKEFFHIWHASFLTILYIGIGSLCYKISTYLYDKKTSLFTTVVILMYMLGNRHILSINQPQVAVFYLLFFLVYLHKTYNRQNKFDYFIYGILLAISFVTNHIYAPLVLIVPFLSIQKNGIKNIKNILIECSMAGVGFFIITGIIALYLYQNDAIADWQYWAIRYPQSIYLRRSSTVLFGQKIYSTNTIIKNIFMLLSLFGIGNNSPIYTSYIQYFISGCVLIGIGIFVYKKYIKKQDFKLSPIETALFVFSILVFWSRTLMTRVLATSSYNLYLIPLLLINIPILFRVFPNFKTKFIKCMQVCFVLCLIYIPVYKYRSQSEFMDSYEKQLVALNPDKAPTVVGSRWTYSLYSTKWKYIYYNAYVAHRYDFRDRIQELNPEIFVVRRGIYGSADSDKNIQFYEYLDQNYTKVSDYIYIYIMINYLLGCFQMMKVRNVYIC